MSGPLAFNSVPRGRRKSAFTLVEVSVATLLVCVGLASIVAIHGRSVQLLRATHQAAAASQILQQRIDGLRSRAWIDLSTSAGLARAMAAATDSESELPGTAITEVLTISPVQASAVGPIPGTPAFRVRRRDRVATVEQAGDLSKETTLLVSSTVSWQDPRGNSERSIRSIVCRVGLTRAGIIGSGLGRELPPAP